MPIFDNEIRKQLSGILSKLNERVNLVYFTQEFECGVCKDTHNFLMEFTELSDKLSLTTFDLLKDSDKAAHYKVDKIPAILLLDRENNDPGIRFFGLPGGYEINSFIQSIYEVSGIREPLPDSLKAKIDRITKDTQIEVFVSLT
jgi:alkyl hydroperoxide reductase subunit AhpF